MILSFQKQKTLQKWYLCSDEEKMKSKDGKECEDRDMTGRKIGTPFTYKTS